MTIPNRFWLFLALGFFVFFSGNATFGQSPNATRTVRMKVTAYCLCAKCCGKYAEAFPRKTATGDDATVCDGVAADPKLLPYRTRLRIPGVGVREVDDTGGGMRQSAKKGVTHIDVRMATHDEARRFGVKVLNVEILDSSIKRKE